MNQDDNLFRVIAWNIRAGGGRRVEDIFSQLRRWAPQVIVLSEFRATMPSKWLAGQLRKIGYTYQRTSKGAEEPARNRVFVASLYPLRLLSSSIAPTEPGRWLMLKVSGPIDLSLGAMHIPNQHTGRKPQFHSSIVALAKKWKSKAGLFIGDTNSGRIGIDEENPVFNQATDQWFDDLALHHWQDVFRMKHGPRREFTWYSPNKGNGFRLDQGFISQPMHRHLHDVSHTWGCSENTNARKDELSDHAALIVDFLVKHGD